MASVALDVLASTDVDLVLLDIMMPVLDGYAVLERRRDDPRLRAIPFIVISATGDDASVIRCIEMGAEDYLPKPFDPVLLRARIGACLEKKRLHDQEQQHLATIEAQAAALAEWNQTLERRVAEQVTRLERLSGLKRFLPPQLAETDRRHRRRIAPGEPPTPDRRRVLRSPRASRRSRRRPSPKRSWTSSTSTTPRWAR